MQHSRITSPSSKLLTNYHPGISFTNKKKQENTSAVGNDVSGKEDKMLCGWLFGDNPIQKVVQQLALKIHFCIAQHSQKHSLWLYSMAHFCHPVFGVIQYQRRQWQVSDRGPAGWYLNTTLKKGIKSPVFHQFNIPNISPGQADSTRLPKKTYGIQLKGSSFSKTVSFSLNFLRRSVWTCFR